MAALLIAGGRAVRQQLLLDAEGSWRDPMWLDQWLPCPPSGSAIDPPAASPQFPLAIQTCPEEALTHLPGIGPVLASRIAAARTSGVHFASPEDLQQVKGIGPKLAQRLAPYLRFTTHSVDTKHDTLLSRLLLPALPTGPGQAP